MKRYVFNPITLCYEVVEEKGVRRVLMVSLRILTGAAVFVFNLWLFTVVLGFRSPKTAGLIRANNEWKAKMALMNREMETCEEILCGIEDRDNHVYRSIFGLNEIPDEVIFSGLEGVNRYVELERSGASQDLSATVRRIDRLAKRAYVQSRALDEVIVVSREAGDMVSHVPAVPPVLPDRTQYRVSSSFGNRTDPVYGGRRFHEGQDFAAAVGYPVYTTADGVVESVRYQFYGYGNEVIVNHGFGYRTRYAHLSRIDVTPGLALKRGDRIGAVGRSGKSTGPHLHYEVIYRNRPVNPWGYMDLDMPVEEYEAMVRNREQDAEYLGNKLPGLSELLERKK